MSKIEKLIAKFLSNPKDLTWDELIKILKNYGFNEITKKGKSGGSRVKFANDNKDIINLHKPHPSNIIKPYLIKQIIQKLKTWQII